MAIWYRYVSDINRDQGNVWEEENNDQVMYDKKKIMTSLEKDDDYF